MSYNIDHIENLSCNLTISRGDLLELLREYETEYRAEINFLDDLDSYLDDYPQTKKIPLTKITWCAEFSGSSYDNVFLEILKHFRGEADLILFWEGGGSVTGLKIRDGKTTECKVKFILEDYKDDSQ